MDTKKRRDFIQNIVIALLSVAAVFLFAQTQIYNLGAEAGYLRFLSAGSRTSGAEHSQTSGLAAPVRVAVTGPYGRYGNVTLSTADAEFESLDRLLGEVLGSARTYTACDPQSFAAALKGTSVYYDFLEPLPLSVLAELVGGAAGEDDISARRLVVSAQNDSVLLYLWDGASAYLRCTTALSVESLESAVSHYELGNAMFAFDNTDPTLHCEDVAPYSLFLESEPALPVLEGSASIADTDALLSALRFNPYTKNRYQEPDGTEVVYEGDRSLRVRTDGIIHYQSGGDASLSVKSAGDVPTLEEAVTGVWSLLGTLSAPGDASLYLQSISQNGSITVLTFGYQVNGVPIRFADGGSAARVTLSEAVVSALELRLRQYTASDTASMLLPLRQALAIAAQIPGAELSIGYADSGGTVSAVWLSD